jgi:hypothetical protein
MSQKNKVIAQFRSKLIGIKINKKKTIFCRLGLQKCPRASLRKTALKKIIKREIVVNRVLKTHF